MTRPRADVLSPIDAATLWPQLHRLSTEVIATRVGDNMLFRAGLAATGVGRLPRMPRTVVLGMRRGLSYRGVLVARELAGGAGWEVVSLRVARVVDDDAVTGLLASAADEVVRRGGRTIYLRYAESSPHEDGILAGGMAVYAREMLLATPPTRGGPLRTDFREVGRADRPAVFRLYCAAVPETVRRVEAPTQQEWRAVFDSYDCEEEYILEGGDRLQAWVGIGEHESRMMFANGDAEECLKLIHRRAGRAGSLVISEYQEQLVSLAEACGFVPLGTRLVAARQLAARNPLKEAAGVRSYPVPN